MANVEALQQLRRVVLDAPDENFEMGSWQSVTPCRTTRCAAGWAALDPWHRANTAINEIFPLQHDGAVVRISPLAVDVDPDEVADRLADVYGINLDDSETLFIPCVSGVKKSAVIDNIDRLIRGEEAVEYDDECEYEDEYDDPDDDTEDDE